MTTKVRANVFSELAARFQRVEKVLDFQKGPAAESDSFAIEKAHGFIYNFNLEDGPVGAYYEAEGHMAVQIDGKPAPMVGVLEEGHTLTAQAPGQDGSLEAVYEKPSLREG